MNTYSGSDYVHAPPHTREIFDAATFQEVVDWVVAIVRRQDFTALAACGHSGLIVAGAAAYILRIPVIAVRKPGDYAKGDRTTINAVLPRGLTQYAFVDDLVGTGRTFQHVVQQMHELTRKAGAGLVAECRGILLYYPGLDDTFTRRMIDVYMPMWEGRPLVNPLLPIYYREGRI